DNYMYLGRGAPVRVTVEVHRTAAGDIFGHNGGFNIQYDSPEGFQYTPWKTVESGAGWATYSFDIPDASFANRDGYDIVINSFGSRQNLIFRSLTVQSLKPKPAT